MDDVYLINSATRKFISCFATTQVSLQSLSWIFSITTQKMKFNIKDFADLETADLVPITEEILNGKLHFFCAVYAPLIHLVSVLRLNPPLRIPRWKSGLWNHSPLKKSSNFLLIQCILHNLVHPSGNTE